MLCYRSNRHFSGSYISSTSDNIPDKHGPSQSIANFSLSIVGTTDVSFANINESNVSYPNNNEAKFSFADVK